MLLSTYKDVRNVISKVGDDAYLACAGECDVPQNASFRPFIEGENSEFPSNYLKAISAKVGTVVSMCKELERDAKVAKRSMPNKQERKSFKHDMQTFVGELLKNAQAIQGVCSRAEMFGGKSVAKVGLDEIDEPKMKNIKDKCSKAIMAIQKGKGNVIKPMKDALAVFKKVGLDGKCKKFVSEYEKALKLVESSCGECEQTIKKWA